MKLAINNKSTDQKQCCGSEIIFSGSGSYLDLNFGFKSGSGLFMKNTLEIQMI
jgi:hypothetical protein